MIVEVVFKIGTEVVAIIVIKVFLKWLLSESLRHFVNWSIVGIMVVWEFF